MQTRTVPERHDRGCEGDERDGVEIWELREEQLDGGEDHDPGAGVEGLAVRASDGVALLEGLAAGDHVDDAAADLHDELLRDDDPKAQLVAERVLAQLVVAVEALPRDALVHLNHLPQCVQGDHPRQEHGHNAGTPACIQNFRSMN
jgi:hypothetical protein